MGRVFTVLYLMNIFVDKEKDMLRLNYSRHHVKTTVGSKTRVRPHLAPIALCKRFDPKVWLPKRV